MSISAVLSSDAVSCARVPPLSYGDSSRAPLRERGLPVTGARRVVLLVVGPHRSVRWRIEMALRIGGFQVLLADDAEDALALLLEGLKPELLLADADVQGVAAPGFVRIAREQLQGGPIVLLGRQQQPQSDTELLDRFERLSFQR